MSKWRWRKSIKLAPGVRMNLSSGGTSWSFGPRGGSISVGKRGVYANQSALGMSRRVKLSGPAQAPRASSRARAAALPAPIVMPTTVLLSADGNLRFLDERGNDLPEHVVSAAKKQAGDSIRDFLEGKCNELREEIEAIGNLHLDTPDPRQTPRFVPSPYLREQPRPPIPQKIGFWATLSRRSRERIERGNAQAIEQHGLELADWETGRADHATQEAARRGLIEDRIYREPEAMEDFLEEVLLDIRWPRETEVSAEVSADGLSAYVDVDLPEVEHMPEATYTLPQRGFRLSRKELSSTQRQKIYMKHIHSIVFRLAGETFAALPKITEVFISGFSQRRDAITGNERDDYLLAARVTRTDWQAMDFSEPGLESLDVVECLTRFELRRSMTKTGVFKAVQPFVPAAAETSG